MHATPSETIAQQVRKRRQLLSLTRAQLAERCADAGAPGLTLAAITNIETGRPDKTGRRRREVTVEELFVLAYVLRINPVDMLVRGDAADDEPYPIAPDVTTTVGEARQWISGTLFLITPETPMDLAVALEAMPKDRARAMSVNYFTPARQAEWNRTALEHDRHQAEDDAE